jgi:hypothetical protein
MPRQQRLGGRWSVARSGRSSNRAIRARRPATSSSAMAAGKNTRFPTARGCANLIPMGAPVSTALGVLRMPGMTAYVGLLEIGQLKPEEMSSSRRPPARSAQSSDKWLRSRNAARSASPAVLIDAVSSSTSSALMPESIIAARISPTCSKLSVPRASTSISRMSKAQFGRRYGR